MTGLPSDMQIKRASGLEMAPASEFAPRFSARRHKGLPLKAMEGAGCGMGFDQMV